MPTLRLNERQATILEFHLPALPVVPLTHVFAALERLRSHTELGPLLIDYSVCQTSLDQVSTWRIVLSYLSIAAYSRLIVFDILYKLV